jgi:hypothetical protein
MYLLVLVLVHVLISTVYVLIRMKELNFFKNISRIATAVLWTPLISSRSDVISISPAFSTYGVPRLSTGVSTAVLHHCGANGHFRVLPRCRCLPLWNIVYGIAGTNEDEWRSKVQMKQEIIPSGIYHESIFAIASHCQVKQQRYLLTIVHILMLAEFRQKSVRSARICRGLPSAKSPQQSPSQIFLTSTRQLSLQMYFFYEPHYDPLPKCDLTNSTRLAYTSPIQWRHEHFSC